jgi:hypothetical protein
LLGGAEYAKNREANTPGDAPASESMMNDDELGLK